MLYYCDHCRGSKESIQVRGKDKQRTFTTGWVGRQLKCGHFIPATDEPIKEGESNESQGTNRAYTQTAPASV